MSSERETGGGMERGQEEEGVNTYKMYNSTCTHIVHEYVPLCCKNMALLASHPLPLGDPLSPLFSH